MERGKDWRSVSVDRVGRCGTNGAKEWRRATRVGRALGRGHGIDRMQNLLVVRTPWACVLDASQTAADLSSCGWCAFAVTSLASQRLVGWGRRGTAAPV
jgi:hypothetical protein